MTAGIELLRPLKPIALTPAEPAAAPGRRFGPLAWLQRRLPPLSKRPALRVTVAGRACFSILCISAASAFVGRGTYASYNAVTSNQGTFSSGSVLMTNAGTSACTAVSSGNCGTMTLTSNSGLTPGDSATGSITISNTGTTPATFTLVASKDATTSTGFDAYLNLTIHDDTTGYCIYGHSSVPFSGACDGLAGLTAQAATDAFPPASSSTLALPGTAGLGTSWAVNESHALTVTVQFINSAGATTQTSKTGSLDLSWTATQGTGTAH